MSSFGLLTTYIVIGSVGMATAVLFGLSRALARACWATAERRRVVAVSAIVLTAWAATAAILAASGVYRGTPGTLPTIQFGIGIPILIGALLLWRSDTVARVLDAVPQSHLVAVQLYRALGAIFLVLFFTGDIPGLFAWPAGIGDIAVGLAAPLVALAYARDPDRRGGTVALWNVAGIADLLIAVGTGFLTAPSVFQAFAFDRPNELISDFPLAMVPLFLVPLSILLHVASLSKLRRDGWRYARLGLRAVTA